jgi:hypothetical protein
VPYSKQKQKEYMLRWRAANREKIKAYHTNHREENREKSRRWAANHPEARLAYQRRYAAENREKVRAFKRRWRAKNPESVAATKRKNKYGLTANQFIALNEAQGGLCKLCSAFPTGRRKHLSVDHDHKTGKVRGLLCNNCNHGLGHFHDNPEILKKAIAYLAASC